MVSHPNLVHHPLKLSWCMLQAKMEETSNDKVDPCDLDQLLKILSSPNHPPIMAIGRNHIINSTC